MSAPLVETKLGPIALRFFRERLANGRTLAQHALTTLPLPTGQISTFLPAGVIPRSLEDFRAGGKLPTPPTSDWKGLQSTDETLLMIPVPNTDYWLVKKIKDYLLQSKNRVCIFEDALKHPSDVVMRKLSTRYAIFGDEIYHLLFHEDAHDERIAETVNAARSVPTFIGAMSVWSGEPQEIRLRVLSLAQLQLLANSAQKLFVGAYDGEGYLIWDRENM